MDDSLATDQELDCFDSTVARIREFAHSRPPFFCNDIKEAMKERDEMKKKLENEQSKHAKEIKALQSKLKA